MTPWCFCVGSARFACCAKKTKINPKYEQTQNTNPKYGIEMMWNTMECKRDSFSGALGGVRETHWECVSHHLKASLFIGNCKFLSNTSIYTLNVLPLQKCELITQNTVEGNAGFTEKVIGSKVERSSGLTGNRILPGEVLPGELSVNGKTLNPTFFVRSKWPFNFWFYTCKIFELMAPGKM